MRGPARPITHCGQVLRKGDRPLEIVTSRQWWIRTLAHKEALARPGPRTAAGTRSSCVPATRTGSGPERATGWSAGSASSACRSRSGTASTSTASRTTTHPADRDEDDLPVDPTTDVPAGLSASQRGVPGGFTAETDVMDTWATSSLTPQIAGGWEDPYGRRPLVAGLPHGPAAPGPRHHPHLAVLHGGALAPRARLPALVRTPPSPAGSSTPTARRCPSRWATSSRPRPCWRSTAPMQSATGRRRGRPGMDTAFDEGQMEVGPEAGPEDPERLEVRAQPQAMGGTEDGAEAQSAAPSRQPAAGSRRAHPEQA